MIKNNNDFKNMPTAFRERGTFVRDAIVVCLELSINLIPYSSYLRQFI